MDQGVISTFKAYYLRRAFSQAVKATTEDNAMTLMEFWKQFNIKNAIKNIAESWREITVSNMKSVWGRILQLNEDNVIPFEPHVKDVSKDIVHIGKELGFENLDVRNVCEYIDAHSDDLDDETLVEIYQQRLYEKKEDEITDTIPYETSMKEFSLKDLSLFIRKIEDASDFFVENDPNVERSNKVRRELRNAIKRYKDMYEESVKKRSVQTTLFEYNFFK
jgi:hypothetical protein